VQIQRDDGRRRARGRVFVDALSRSEITRRAQLAIMMKHADAKAGGLG
jgi:hypothetical protein